MSNELLKTENKPLAKLQNINELVSCLMKTPHYAKLGQEGIFAIVSKANSMNVEPLEALNGGLYYVKGKVEMSSAMMNQLIRQKGHSISKDKRSNDAICILHGKRADTSDTWTESFSIEEAKRAGIYVPNGTWVKYPRDMLFARALSRLARQLFPDVIKGCYVQGEIADALPLNAPVNGHMDAEVKEIELISEQDADNLKKGLESFADLEENVTNLVNDRFDGDWLKMPRHTFDNICKRIESRMIEEASTFKEQENITPTEDFEDEGV